MGIGEEVGAEFVIAAMVRVRGGVAGRDIIWRTWTTRKLVLNVRPCTKLVRSMMLTISGPRAQTVSAAVTALLSRRIE